MNINEFREKYNGLINEAQTALTAGDTEKAEKLKNEAQALETKFNDEATTQANKNAKAGVVTLPDLKDVSQPVNGTVVNSITDKTATYENAWAKHLLGKEMSAEETSIYENTNRKFLNDASFTHTTINTPTLIPDTVVAGIWKRAEEQYPLWGDIKGFSVKGTLTFNKHKEIESGDAAWYDEATPTADEKNTFVQLRLDGKELSKSVTVSWKMKTMAIPEFVTFLEQELAERIGVALGLAAYNGNGVDQPTGIKTALNADDEGKKQILNYTGQIKYADMTSLISTLYSSYTNGACFYATNGTVWNQLANIVDGNGRPYFIPDTTSGGVGRLFGYVVKADAGVDEGDLLFGNVTSGVVKNQNAPLSITTETHAKAREDDYVAYTVVDANVLDKKALAILTPKVAATTPAK